MPTATEPSKQDLRAIPEIDFGRAKRLPRGKYAEKAHRSFAVAILDAELFARFGSSEAIRAALQAVGAKLDLVDALRRDDIEQARRTTPEERAGQALQMMRAGFRLKQAALRARYPRESDEEIDARFRQWLAADDRG